MNCYDDSQDKISFTIFVLAIQNERIGTPIFDRSLHKTNLTTSLSFLIFFKKPRPMKFKFFWLILFLTSSFVGKSSDLIFKNRVASVLNTVTLYPDSSYFTSSNIHFSEGTLLTVLGETVLQHLDDAQNQKFKWYQVRTSSGQEGWVFGDGIAVIMEDKKVNPLLRDFHKKKISLNNGFEKSVIWTAAVEGRDNLHENDLLNSTYHEYYIVITNEHGQSVHIDYEGQSAMGRKEIQLFQMKDLSGDGISEFLLQTKSYSASSDLENRVFEVFSIQSGSLKKVFNERMTLTYDDDLISPAMFKNINVNGQSIRVEYVDYISCDRFSLDYSFDRKSQTQERCIEFVTYTYAWDTRKKRFEIFYKKNKTPLKGVVTQSKIFLKSETSFLSKKIEELQPHVPFLVIKHFEKIFMQNGKKKIAPYLYVQSANGNRGYIRGKNVRFLNTEHAAILNDFYKKPPLSKTELKTNRTFLKITAIGESGNTSLIQNSKKD